VFIRLLEQGYSPYFEQRLRVPTGRSACTPFTPHTAYLRSNVPEFIEPENWPPNSPDLNLADNSVRGALQQMVYRHKISDTDQLQQVLIDSWAQLSQYTLNRATDQLPKRLTTVIKPKGGHVELHLD